MSQMAWACENGFPKKVNKHWFGSENGELKKLNISYHLQDKQNIENQGVFIKRTAG